MGDCCKGFSQGSMIVRYSAQYSIFQNVLITTLVSNLHLLPPEFVPPVACGWAIRSQFLSLIVFRVFVSGSA